MKKILLLFLVTTIVLQVNAQFGANWKMIRHEASINVGGTNFMGELGGRNAIGSNNIVDFDFLSSRFAAGAAYRYKYNKRWASRVHVGYLMISGADSLSFPRDGGQIDTDNHRYARDLSFRASVVEFGGTIEFSIIPESFSSRYNLHRVKGLGSSPNLYIYTGIYGIYYNPKGKYLDGNWYNLRDLGTEGQNYLSTRSPYSKVNIAIPVGVGMNFMLDRNWGIGFDYGFRFTLTDYLDDVSTTYVDTDAFEGDPIAQYFHDPTLGTWNGSGTFNQRGNEDRKDVYMVLNFTVTYKIRSRKATISKF